MRVAPNPISEKGGKNKLTDHVTVSTTSASNKPVISGQRRKRTGIGDEQRPLIGTIKSFLKLE